MPATSAPNTLNPAKKRARRRPCPRDGRRTHPHGRAARGDPHVSAPLQHERSSPLAPGPVAELVPDHRPEDAEDYGVLDTQVALLGQDTGGQEDGLARQRHPVLSSITPKKTAR